MATLKNTTINSTGALQLPVGTTAQRPAVLTAGMMRYNSSLNTCEVYDGNGVWRYAPDIVRTGLVLHLDAAEPSSYSGSGTTWYDISGNSNNGTLVNGPVYENTNNGILTFNSTKVVTVPMTNLRPTSQITQESWFKITNNVPQVFVGSQYGNASNNSYAIWINAANSFAAGVNIGGSFNYSTQSYSIILNKYYQFLHTYDGTYQKIYLDGIMIKSWSTSGSISYDLNNTLLAIGNDWNSGYDSGASVGIQGSLSSTRIYNRALSPSEIQQNFNALRGRYGL